MKAWQKKFSQAENFKISVNLSGKQLQQKNFVKIIDRTIKETGIQPQNMKLEITESMLMENETQVTEKIRQIRERNIKISLDDFGTGYYSLSYLHRFPINTLKVDQSFIRRIGDRNRNLEIVQGIITLTHTLSMDIIPEGIEIDFHLT